MYLASPHRKSDSSGDTSRQSVSAQLRSDRAVLHVVTMLLLSASLSAHAREYLFVGISRPPLVASQKCPAFDVVLEEHQSQDAAKAMLQEFLRAPGRVDKSVDVYGPERVSIVYKYRGRSNEFRACPEYTRYSKVSGRSEDLARAQMKSNQSEFKENYLGEPEVVRIWGRGAELSAANKEELHGVVLEYKVAPGERGTIVVKLTSISAIAMRVRYATKTRELAAVTLGPQETATLNLGPVSEGFGVDIFPVQNQDDLKRTGAVNAIKGVVREYVTKPDGGVQEKSTIWGVRG